MHFSLQKFSLLFQCLIYGFLVSNIYKSSLVAHLTRPSYSKTVVLNTHFLTSPSYRKQLVLNTNLHIFNPEHQVDTLEELVASDDFSWGIELNTAEHQLFSTSEVTLRLSTTKM